MPREAEKCTCYTNCEVINHKSSVSIGFLNDNSSLPLTLQLLLLSKFCYVHTDIKVRVETLFLIISHIYIELHTTSL